MNHKYQKLLNFYITSVFIKVENFQFVLNLKASEIWEPNQSPIHHFNLVLLFVITFTIPKLKSLLRERFATIHSHHHGKILFNLFSAGKFCNNVASLLHCIHFLCIILCFKWNVREGKKILNNSQKIWINERFSLDFFAFMCLWYSEVASTSALHKAFKSGCFSIKKIQWSFYEWIFHTLESEKREEIKMCASLGEYTTQSEELYIHSKKMQYIHF